MWLLDGTKKTFWLHTDEGNANVALPDNQHALSASAPHHQALQRQRWHRPAHLHAPHGPGALLALLPDGLRFVSGSSDNTARIAYHGLAPLPSMKYV